jgi:hypothetical protein
METLSFTTRAGLAYKIRVTEDIGHALVGEVLEAKRKHFIGKYLAFPKHDMASVKRVAA